MLPAMAEVCVFITITLHQSAFNKIFAQSGSAWCCHISFVKAFLGCIPT
ncbi:hypothetical protein AO377_1010 [Moraxella catarrhalis]|nr:hypothetical protein AO377_1010 [Moraxella catarrhalis]OAV16613.1 hypothetical protein AO375_0499 [Moraxella catarrhalis]